MALLRRPLTRRRRRTLVLLLALAGLALLAGLNQAARERPVPDGPVRSAGEVAREQARADAQAAAEATESTEEDDGAGRPATRATPVPDVPLAWKRVRRQSLDWPAAAQAPPRTENAALPTVPASRVRDTIGLNIDLWRTEAGYRDFNPVLAKVAELQLRHARVTMQAAGNHGLTRMQNLGRIGVRLDVLLGDALGRYGMAPFGTVAERLRASVLPYVDSVEGTNEPDLAKQAGWEVESRTHQEEIVRAVARERGDPVGVIAPSVGRLTSLPALGRYDGLADAANAHAYSSAAEPSGALDQWQAALLVQLPRQPVVVTEAGFQDDVGQTKYHTPLPAQIAADYVPRTILEAMRRGIPRVYLYEMIDRWDDPFGVDTSAHFGLLDTSLRNKPAWNSLLRLQRTLLDDGRPDREAQPLRATVIEGPDDLRLLAFRRRDGTAAIAVWRAVSQWDTQALTAVDPGREDVRIQVDGELGGARRVDLGTGDTARLGPGNVLALRLGGAPVVVDGITD